MELNKDLMQERKFTQVRFVQNCICSSNHGCSLDACSGTPDCTQPGLHIYAATRAAHAAARVAGGAPGARQPASA
eukprot:1157236-Pelagomonas_calceolata.AAC.5